MGESLAEPPGASMSFTRTSGDTGNPMRRTISSKRLSASSALYKGCPNTMALMSRAWNSLRKAERLREDGLREGNLSESWLSATFVNMDILFVKSYSYTFFKRCYHPLPVEKNI
jgi:hypothetical protein